MENKNLLHLLKNLEVYFENQLISGNKLLEAMYSFMNTNYNKTEPNTNMILHTGSILYDIAAIIYAVFLNIILDENSSESIYENFKIGDFIIYTDEKNKIKKYRYEGREIKNSKNYFRLTMDKDGTVRLLPESEWGKVAPYKGNSKSLTNQGIRQKGNNQFIIELEKLLHKKIPALISTSCVFVIPKKHIEIIVKDLSFSLNNAHAKLTEITSVSYYTSQENYYQIGTNPLKCEANIQFASKLSLAKRLLLSKSGNTKICFFISGKELIKRYYSELIILLNKKSIQTKFILQNIDSETAIDILTTVKNINLFACTKKFLKPYSELISKTYSRAILSNSYLKDLNNQICLVSNQTNEKKILTSLIRIEDYIKFKKALKDIRNSDFESKEKDNFIVQAFSLLNLFSTAIFPMDLLDKIISTEPESRTKPIIERLDEIKFLQNNFPIYLKEKSQFIIFILEKTYLNIKSDLPQKGKEFENLLKTHYDKKIAVIIPKAYFSKVLTSMFPQKNISFVTANKFNNSEIFDITITLGNIEGSHFNTFKCSSAKKIITLLYDYEERLYNAKEKNWNKIENLYNKLAETPLKRSEIFEEFQHTEKEYEEELAEETEIENFIKEFTFSLTQSTGYTDFYSQSSFENKVFMSEVICAATFTTGEKAFFSKNYKPYIFDNNSEEAKEIESSELSEGDFVIFTRKDSTTSDVVEEILQVLISENKLSEMDKNAYLESKIWKNSLKDFKKTHSLKSKDLANMLSNKDINVQELTIRQWLNPDSRTVGPREANSIKQIGILVGNKILEDNYEYYYKSCKTVRKIRRNILKKIEEAIILKLNKKLPENDNMLLNIYGKIDSLAEVLQIDSIIKYEKQIPANLVNKPLRISGF